MVGPELQLAWLLNDIEYCNIRAALKAETNSMCPTPTCGLMDNRQNSFICVIYKTSGLKYCPFGGWVALRLFVQMEITLIEFFCA